VDPRQSALHACALFVLAPWGAARAQPTAVVRGRVLADATETPIRGAQVSASSLARTATTDSLGRYRLEGIPPGPQIIWVRRMGFAPLSTVQRLTAGDTLDLELTLVASAQPLPEVDVTAPPHLNPKLAGFERRRSDGFGHFITPDVLAKNSDRRLSEVLSLIAGPQVLYGTSSMAWVYFGRRGTASFVRGKAKLSLADTLSGAKGLCYSGVVLDGVFVYTGQDSEGLFDINSVSTKDVAAMEFYSGGATMPPEYNGTRNTCGLLIIWTR
jgi:hypothetical protein